MPNQDNTSYKITEQQIWEQNTEHCGFPIAYLRDIFNQVMEPDDWKAKINIKMSEDKFSNIGREAMETAIFYFTATTPVILKSGKQYWIRADGYRLGPCGESR